LVSIVLRGGITVAADPALPTYDYLKICPTDLQKYDRNDQVILLKAKRPPNGKPAKTTKKKGTKKTKK